MKKFTVVAMATFLLIGTAALAQMQDQSSQSTRQSQVSLLGKISSIDLARGILTLDNGTQFTLPPNLQYTSFPMVGQEVEVIYEEQGTQKVVRSIDQGFEGKSNE